MTMTTASHLVFLGVDDLAAARSFYKDVLGLRLMADEDEALVFDLGSAPLRISRVENFHPQAFTVLGWTVADITAEALKLAAAGVTPVRYPQMPQDENGIATLGTIRIMWFLDPAGNNLSLTQA